MRNSTLRTLLFILPMASVLAQTAALQMNVVYVCTDGNSFKVFSCTGSADLAVCDLQNYQKGQAFQRGQLLRKQLTDMVPAKCHAQTAAEAQADPHRGEIPAGAAAALNPAQAGVGGFKVGDTVRINTAFGWMDAKVLQVNGANYYVHAQSGADVWKPYPAELRRVGPLNAEDRQHGLYDLHDRVQVNFENKWVDSEVITTMAQGDQYEVTLPGNRKVWATPQQLKFVSVAPPPVVTKAGVAPKPGFTSCAGKIEGRYAMSNGGQDIELDLNKDGTIDSAFFGELKKKN